MTTAAFAWLRNVAARPRTSRVAVWLVLVASVAVAYGWTLDEHLLADDFALIGRFHGLQWSAWPTLFFQDWAHGIWPSQVPELRPIAALTFMIDGRVWGTDATGYHLTNLFLHLLCSALVMLITLEVLGIRPLAALAAGLIFSLHPAAAESVVWVSGRVDLLATAGLLAGFLGFLRYRRDGLARWLVLACSAFGLGVFAKEACLLLPAVTAAYDVTCGVRRTSWWKLLAPYAAWAAVTAAYLYCRSFGMGLIFTEALAEVGTHGMGERLTDRVIPYALAMLLSPGLSIKVGIHGAGSLGLGVLVVLAGAILWLRLGPRRGDAMVRAGVFFGLVWPIVTLVPLIVTYRSFRHLYPALAGLAIGVVIVLVRRPANRWRYASAAAVIVVCAVQLAAELPRFDAAFTHSQQISAMAQRVADVASRGDVLIVDVPPEFERTWVWGWASPFALRPPFVSRNLAVDLVVIERPDVYRAPTRWPSPGTIPRLRAASGEGWLISRVDGAYAVQRLNAEALEAVRMSDLSLGTESFERLMATLGDLR